MEEEPKKVHETQETPEISTIQTAPVFTEHVHHVEKEIPIVEKHTTVIHDQPVVHHEKVEEVVQEPPIHDIGGETVPSESVTAATLATPTEPIVTENVQHITREIPIHETERTIIHEKPIVTHESAVEHVREVPVHVDSGLSTAESTTTTAAGPTPVVTPTKPLPSVPTPVAAATTTPMTTTTTNVPQTHLEEELPPEKKPGLLHKLKEDIKHVFRGDRS